MPTHDQIGTHTCTKSTGRNIGLDVTINRSIKWLLIECVKTFNKVALSILEISTIALHSIYHTCLWRCGLCGCGWRGGWRGGGGEDH